jgi:hypothetical protein
VLAEVAGAIREGRISGRRLQEYCRARYDIDRLASAWCEALLSPPEEWRMVPRA